MIKFENGIFAIHSPHYSCLLGLTPQGHLEQIHYGRPVPTTDAAALRFRSGNGWGACVLLDDKDASSCLDTSPLAWSGSGRGDYRESPLEIGISTDLRYVGHEIVDGDILMSQGLPQAKGARQTLVITLEQPGLRCKLFFTDFEEAMTRRAVLINTGKAPVELQKMMSFCIDLPGEFHMRSFHGSWISEMRHEIQPVGATKLVNESLTGSSSNRHNPGFLLYHPEANENYGEVYGINLVYSGNHYASVQRSHQGFTRILQGVNPANFRKKLEMGEIFETPEAVLCWSGQGFNGQSQNMHSFILKHIVPAYWRSRPRPVLYNSWEGCMFDFDQRKLLSLAKEAKDLGCELFVLDDGWFGKRNDDTSGLGDYSVNPKKLPKGLGCLSHKLKAMGLKFGLWFEPEAVSPDSDLYRAHPDWALTDAFEPILGRHQLLLDLTKPQVRDYIVDNITHIIDSADISYVKWDMNRHSIALGHKAHDFILGLYDVLRRIFEPRPQVLLESCSSGGNRFDLGMLCFGPQVWASDNTDPIERIGIQKNLSYLYPQSCFGAHVSAAPHAQTLRNTPLSTRGNVAFFGCLGYELDLHHLLELDKKEIKKQIAFYRQYRSIFQFGQFSRLDQGFLVRQGKTCLVGIFRGLVPAAPGYESLRIPGLRESGTYHLSTREQVLRIGQFGGLIKHALPINLNPNSLAMRALDRRITLPEGQLELSASGAAFMRGIALLPQFRGTGYDKNQRTLTDFSSEIYIIEEEN